jgi:hypothetical protein
LALHQASVHLERSDQRRARRAGDRGACDRTRERGCAFGRSTRRGRRREEILQKLGRRLLLFRAGIRPASVALEVIDKSPSVSVLYSTAALHQDARAWLARFDDQVISYTDAVSFALMKARRCKQAISFDQDFVIAGYSLWHGAT